jgi:hypothetical protein
MHTHTKIVGLPVILTLGILATACSSPREGGSSPSTDSGKAASGGMSGMQGGMAKMQGMASGPMMVQMQAHLRILDGASGDSLQAMLAMHRSMVANLMSQCNDEMRTMHMPADPTWQATTDSLRQDLIRLPNMTASQLHAFMPEHTARILRLMDMHRSMMSSMKTGMTM